MTNGPAFIHEDVDIAQLVDELRTAVASPDGADVDLLRDAAAQYGEMCDRANRRLVECHSLLKRGLRSEALQACERDPQVLQLVEILDFPERYEWNVLLQQWGMAQPPLLKIDLAADLNEAYAEEESLSGLLKKHRLLALARAPLANRITVLRNIRQRDPANPAWDQDLVKYERSRLKEIHAELTDAERTHNAQKVAMLQKELGYSKWTIAPEDELVRRCDQMHARLQAEFARTQLATAERQLSEAYSAFDVDEARAAKLSWETYFPTANLPDDDPLLERVQPAFDWLSEQEQLIAERTEFEIACQKLEADLDRDASLDVIQRRYHTIQRMEREVPELLQLRYDQRVQADQLSTRRKFRIIMAITTGSLFIVATVVILFILNRQHANRVVAAVTALESLIDAGNIDGAHAAFEDLRNRDDAIAAEPELLAIKSRIDTLWAKELERRNVFERSMAAAVQSGPEDPDRVALRRAREVATTASEKAQVRDFEAEVERQRSRRQREHDEEFLLAFKEVEDLLQQADTPQAIADAARQELVERTRSRLESILAAHRSVSPPIKEQSQLVFQRLDAIDKDIEARQIQRQSLAELTRSVGNVKAYTDAAQKYVKRHPESSLASDLGRITQESDLWTGVSAWSSFLSRSAFDNLRSLTAETARQLLEEGQSLLKQHDDIPLADEFRQRAPFLESIKSRVDDDGQPIYEPLIRLQRDSLISNIWMLQTKDGARYYLQEKPDLTELDNAKRALIKYISGPDYSMKSASIKVPDIEYDDLSPQTLLMKDVCNQLKNMSNCDWDKIFWAIAQRISEDKHLDPILKYLLLDRTLTIACQGSVLMESSLGAFRQELDESSFDLGVNWLDPDDSSVNNLRRQIAALLDQMPNPSDIQETIKEESRLLDSAPPQVAWIGILLRGDDNRWTCGSEIELPADGELYVVTSNAQTAEAELALIGKASGGTIDWHQPFDDRFVQGRPVFLRSEGSTK